MGLERVEVHRKNVFVKLSDAVLVKFLKLKKWVVLKVLCFRKCAIEVNFVAFLKLLTTVMMDQCFYIFKNNYLINLTIVS